MKRIFTILTCTAVCAGWTLPAQATSIEFEAFVDGQNLHGVNLGGVTLYEPQLGVVRVYANGRLGSFYQSPVNSVSSDESTLATYPIVGVFGASQNSVSLWAGDAGGDVDQWELEVFDAATGGNSLGLVQSVPWSGNPYTQLSVTTPGIWRFEARNIGSPAGITYDDLSFSGTVVPVPGAVILGGIGMGLVSCLRRRRTL
ncbi:MAG: hypothetical protein MUC88_10840 [Planctomycetes bacterium]|jgi:hypothetical protein|nr:hypothetical protein [Planctomycetota bacterium]